MNQIFKLKCDIDIIYDYFNQIGIKQLDKFLIFNEKAYNNKLDVIDNLYKYLSNYYHESKKYYLTREKCKIIITYEPFVDFNHHFTYSISYFYASSVYC